MPKKSATPQASVKAPAPAKKRATPKAKPAAPKKIGRPSKRTPEIEAEMLRRISEGETLRSICRDDHMPSFSTAYSWMDDDEDFSARFARAREKGEEAILQQCMDIADDDKRDWTLVQDNDGNITGVKVDGEHVQRSKLKIWTRMELLKRWNPKKWGDKVDLNHGVQPENPLAKLLEQVQGTPMRPGGGGK